MPIRIDVVTLFPDLVEHFCSDTILGRARSKDLLDLRLVDPREHTSDVHRTVDDTPFGGGAGMVLKPEPLFDAVEAADVARPLLLLAPGGRRFDQRAAEELAELDGFGLLCGRYEGIDQRVVEHLVDDELSVGDVVLAGGEAAALVVIEAVTRLVPGVLGNAASPEEESFADGLLEHPQWTRPAEFRGWAVPEVLRSGDHARVRDWRRIQRLIRTARRGRFDLLDALGGVSDDDRATAARLGLADELDEALRRDR
ncbi:MAG: tRNA (guanosine(37)-N1)-methyltransferase TrmD [Actinomycetota bacterium]